MDGEGQQDHAGEASDGCAVAPELLDRDQSREDQHGGQVHDPERDEHDHQRPATSQAVGAVGNADAQVARAAVVVAVMQQFAPPGCGTGAGSAPSGG